MVVAGGEIALQPQAVAPLECRRAASLDAAGSPSAMAQLSDRAAGALLVAGACLCWSSGGILVRMLALDGLVIVFWRSLFMALAVGLALVVVHGRQAPARIAAVGWHGLLSGVLLSGAFIGYIVSLTLTQVANTMVLMSASPLVAAVLARLILKERLSGATVVAITVAMTGIAVMFGHGIAAGSFLGDALALFVALTFGANIVVLRRWREIDMVPATMLGGLISAALTAPWALTTPVGGADLAVLACLGCFQLGLGLFLFVRGSRRLGAAELGLLCLLETILAPVWVWIGIGETPTPMAMLGGGLVLTAVVGLTLCRRMQPVALAAEQGAARRCRNRRPVGRRRDRGCVWRPRNSAAMANRDGKSLVLEEFDAATGRRG
jgi:drug/metabolite transporter (DMT)-like permease